MSSTQVPHVVNGMLLAVLVGGSLWVYPTLPAQIPRHFDLFGQADAYWTASLVHWLLVPIVAVFSAAALYGPAGMVDAVPSSWIQMPNQEQYEALSPAKKQFVRALVQQALYWTATATLVLLLAVQGSIYYVATTGATALPAVGVGAMLAALLAIAGLTGWFIWRLPKRIRALSSGAGSEDGADPSRDDR